MIEEQVAIYKELKEEIVRIDDVKNASNNPIVITTLTALSKDLGETVKGLTETIFESVIIGNGYHDKLLKLDSMNDNIKLSKAIIEKCYTQLTNFPYPISYYTINEEFLNLLLPFYRFRLDNYDITEKDLNAFETLIYPEPLILYKNQKLNFYKLDMMIEIVRYYFTDYSKGWSSQAVGKK